jgi:serpin B
VRLCVTLIQSNQAYAMKRLTYVLLLVAAVLTLNACREDTTVTQSAPVGPESPTSPTGPTSPATLAGPTEAVAAAPAAPAPVVGPTAVVNAYNDFACRFQRTLAAQDKGKNVFVSPFSIAVALTMTYNGARGQTAQAMARTLALEGIPRDAVNQCMHTLTDVLQLSSTGATLAVANSLWVCDDVQFKPDFIARVRDNYAAELASVNFLAPDTCGRINGWVSAKTRDKIRDLVPPPALNKDTLMVLVNAIYFKGQWDAKFDPAQTREREFTNGDGTKSRCKMMEQHGDFAYAQTPLCQAIRLPYVGKRLCMYVFLPAPDKKLEDLLAALDPATWQTWRETLHQEKGTIVLPRFRLEYSAELKKPLSQLGMAIAFDRDHADFLDMATEEAARGRICISEVFHKAFVEVNEEGTEAAAATAVVMMRVTAVMPERRPFQMVVDRPFLCVICDEETGAMLFMGAIQAL